ncbi:nicotinamide mononucleotide transporter [Candidatus Peregrinibacteria bacterium]|nr:nicotinamide mononucleotide transporter [Candidatus Peregrinibacteria bacterium]
MFLQEILRTSLIELIAGFGYLIGHFLLSQKRISGWIFKIIGGIAWVIFLFDNENFIFMAVSIVMVFTMIYGFSKWKVGKFTERTNIDAFFEILAAIVAIFMILKFVLSGISQLAPIFETIIVIAEILGTVFLARKKIAGWYSYIVMSSFAGILVIFINPNPAVLLGILEMASLYFYYKGIRNFSKNKKRVF